MSTNNRNVVNGVKGNRKIASLGRNLDVPQVESDRHPATAGNDKKKLRRKWKKQTRRIATWNVRTMLQKGKINNVINEMSRMRLDVLGISEMRWNGSGVLRIDDHTVYYSGNDKHSHGVGFILSKQMSTKIMATLAVSDRVLLIKLKGTHQNLALIQVYAPTSAADEETMEKFYDDIDSAMKQCRHNDCVLVLGDFNAKVGSDTHGGITGNWGLGATNERGEALTEWCIQKDLCIANTFFEKKPEKLWTWCSPDKCTKNQIDYILIKRRFRNAILDVETDPNADCDTDHNPLICKLRLRLQHKAEKSVTKSYIDWNACDEETLEKYQKLFWESYGNPGHNVDFEKLNASFALAKECLPKKRVNKHKPWMTPEILDLMEKRRLAKVNNDHVLYASFRKKIRTMCNEAKEEYLKHMCDEITNSYNRSPKEAHLLIKKLKGSYLQQRSIKGLKSKSGKLLSSSNEIMCRWEEYVRELYSDASRVDKPLLFTPPLDGDELLLSELEHAVKKTKLGKAEGPDGVSTEMFLHLSEEGKSLLHKALNELYNSGEIPRAWQK